MMSVMCLCLYVEDVLDGVDLVMPGGYQTLINLVKQGIASDEIRGSNRRAQAECCLSYNAPQYRYTSGRSASKSILAFRPSV